MFKHSFKEFFVTGFISLACVAVPDHFSIVLIDNVIPCIVQYRVKQRSFSEERRCHFKLAHDINTYYFYTFIVWTVEVGLIIYWIYKKKQLLRESMLI